MIKLYLNISKYVKRKTESINECHTRMNEKKIKMILPLQSIDTLETMNFINC